MKKKSSVYTKRGDKGETGLVSGSRISKSDKRINLYGEVDELNACMGVVASYMKQNAKHQEDYEFLLELQSVLFDLGSNLACEAESRTKFQLPIIRQSSLEKIEFRIDSLDVSLPKLTHFILPGGCLTASHIHVCRTVCRRVERKLVAYEEAHPDESVAHAKEFLNRLSDYFFVLARYVNNKAAHAEIYWQPVKETL